ncbi:MAG: ABC transporter permease [Planctomycetia bacterium]|nr:ABC transporter permease [Planctomycetia bacterium]
MELIRLEDIHKTYVLGEVDVPVLKGVSLSIDRGEMVALMGPSGSGKTTLMNILGCLDRPTSGRYWLDGQEMSRLTPNQRALVRTGKLGFVFQSFNLLPRTTAAANVMMPLDYAPRRPPVGQSRRLAETLLTHVGLEDRLDHEPSQMSGGQQQRVAIARALVNRPALVLADEPTGNLDSHTSVEILRMFRQLNDEGITVILVTHDPNVAAYAHRVIRIDDGRIESDGAPSGARDDGHGTPESPGARSKTAVLAVSAPVVAATAPKSLYGEALPKPRRWKVPTAIPPTLRTALGALRRNKMRSALTTLGVIIGVGAVIAMMEIGEGSKAALQKTIASMGANVLMVRSGAASSGGVSFGAGSVLTLTPDDAEEILRQCPSVSDVAPIVRTRSQIIYGSRNWVPTFIYGTTPSFLAVQDWENLDEGEMFNPRDVLNGNKVCVIGQTLVRELFQGEYPIGKELRIQNVLFRVIGVLRRKGANMMGMDQDDIVLAPWTTVKYRVSATTLTDVNQSAKASGGATGEINSLNDIYPGSQSLYPVPSAMQAADTPQPVRFTNVDEIRVKAASAGQIPRAIDEITALLRQRHRIHAGEPDDFNVRDMAEMTRALSSTSRLMGALLLVVALISLVVGGVGIMNIMLVSVTERTREIGLRMAVGARGYHILRQFLVEAVVLCLFGGAMGILLGRGVSVLVSSILLWTTQASVPAIVAAVAVSATVGVAFGFYPAWKASRLDPIEALRYE